MNVYWPILIIKIKYSFEIYILSFLKCQLFTIGHCTERDWYYAALLVRLDWRSGNLQALQGSYCGIQTSILIWLVDLLFSISFRSKNLVEYSCQTLGVGNIKGAVRLPAGEDLNEWLAANTVDFFNELSILWGIICDFHGRVPVAGPGEGFPPGFEYLWATSKYKSAKKCSGPEYIGHVLDWVEGEINNDAVFPSREGKSV